MENKQIRIGDLPSKLVDEIKERISLFSVALGAFFGDKEKNHLQLVGSGTLVVIKDTHAILTAKHVTKDVRKYDRVGVLLGTRTYEECTIEKDHFYFVEIDSRCASFFSPDLALMIIPNTEIGTIEARKVFFNMDLRRDNIMLDITPDTPGMWMISGYPKQMGDAAPEVGLVVPLQFSTRIIIRHNIHGYDYYDCEWPHGGSISPPTVSPPQSLRGVSGGGLWHARIIDKNGNLFLDKVVLSGVSFWESSRLDEYKFIRCHGRKSLYQKLYDFL